MRRTSIVYHISKFLCLVFFKIGWRFQIKGTHHIPQKGPAIVASNHRSYADPPLVGIAIPRVVHILAKKELFHFKPFGWFISRLNAHPINRSSGIGALRVAQDILEEGGVVILFPEGRRSKTDVLQKPKHGVGMLALKTKVPVIPAYIHNSGHLFQFKRVSVTYGPPIDPHKFHSYESLTVEVMSRIQKMKNQIG